MPAQCHQVADLLAYSAATGAALVASTVSATAGFGGAILLLPVLTALFGIEKALPLLALAQLVGNAFRAFFGFRTINWRAVICFNAGAIPLAVMATAILVNLPLAEAKLAATGFIVLVALFEAGVAFSVLPGVSLRLMPNLEPGFWLSLAGALVGIISAIAGSSGPLPNAFFLRLRLSPPAYVATDAATMGILHSTKLAAFGLGQNWSLPAWQLCMTIAAAMIAGTWFGRRVLGKIDESRYRRCVAVWMLVVALSMFFVPADGK